MNWNRIERIVAAFVFAWGLVLYMLTVAPTASFWDSGEFIAIANRLQVSHPPGAPFYMLIGRAFSMFASPENVAFAVNLVSVFASAFTVLLTHLIIVRVAREWQAKEDADDTRQRVSVLAGGVIGSLTFAATDSFWFNAVEAEVYALSMFFTAVVIWLIMKWSEQARLEESTLSRRQQTPFGLSANRYLVLIAYLFGLAIGVHLLNLLAIFFIALIFYFVEIERNGWDTRKQMVGLILTGVVSSVAFLIIYPGIILVLPSFVGGSGAPLITALFILLLLTVGLYVTQRRKLQVANLALLSLTVVLIGYSSYALIFIRSAADPPIDENDPETVEAIVSYLNREQYGNTPHFMDASYDNRLGQINYDKEVLFPRRHSPAPEHLRQYSRYRSDAEFFLRYQLNHMYIRYFLWNFVGRGSDEQDAPAITGFSFIDDPAYAADRFVQTPSERESRNAYYGLPLLLGIFGAMYHFMRDWRRAFSVMVLFFITGIGIILYLNQTPLQPRERDYSYVASFFAFSLWIGIGATGVLQLVIEAVKQRATPESNGGVSMLLLGGIASALFLLVPMLMTVENFHDHDRSGRYVAPEYAHNMLMSVADDAILITNGDNDTFPLWYLQEVEQQRQDVRVVNVSLLNTSWYIKQLKNQYSRDSEPLPISYTDDEIENLTIEGWQPRELELPVRLDRMLNQSEVHVALEDTGNVQSPMRWELVGRPYSQDVNLLYVADQALYDILRTNAEQDWKRPFYFAVTVSQDGQLNLENFFQLEGQAFRVVPIEHEEPLGRVVPSITPERLRTFKFTNLNDPEVYYDENIRRMVDNYRNVFVQTAQALATSGDRAQALELMDTLMTAIPFETIPGTERSYLIVSRAFQFIDADERAVDVMKKAEPVILNRLAGVKSNNEAELAAQYVQMLQLGYLNAGDFEAASAFSDKIAEVLDDDAYRQTPDELRRQRDLMFAPAEPAQNDE